jgi:hypothetical protein
MRVTYPTQRASTPGIRPCHLAPIVGRSGPGDCSPARASDPPTRPPTVRYPPQVRPTLVAAVPGGGPAQIRARVS